MSTTPPFFKIPHDNFAKLQTSSTVNSRFNAYIYKHKLYIREKNNSRPGYHSIRCTSCVNDQIQTVKADYTTTSSYIRHYQKHHPGVPVTERALQTATEALCDSNKSKTTPWTRAAEATSRKTTGRFENAVYRELLVQFMIESNCAFRLVELKSFRNFVSYCSNSARSITRFTIRRGIRRQYQEMFPRIKTRLISHVDGGGTVSLTLDAWTSSNNTPFLGITAHFLEKITWSFQSLLIGFEPLAGSHTSENLAKVTHKVVQKFGIENAVHTITSDNASVNVAMFRILEGLLPRFTVGDGHIRCMAHVINLAAQTVLETLKANCNVSELYLAESNEISTKTDIGSSLKIARCIVAKIRSSKILWEALKNQASAENIKPLRPLLDMKVRWNSTYDMLERLIYLKPAINNLCKTNTYLSSKGLVLDESDWKFIKRLRDILWIFVRGTKDLSGSSYPTLARQLPYYVHIMAKLEKEVVEEAMENSYEYENPLWAAVDEAWNVMRNYYNKTGSVQNIATILDPRAKLKTFANLSWDDEDINTAKGHINFIYSVYYAHANPPETGKPTTFD